MRDPIAESLAQAVSDSGIKKKFIAQKSGIPYHRVLRILASEGVVLTASEFLRMCSALQIDPAEMKAQAASPTPSA